MGLGVPRQPYLFRAPISFTNNLKTAGNPASPPFPSLPPSPSQYTQLLLKVEHMRHSGLFFPPLGHLANIKSRYNGHKNFIYKRRSISCTCRFRTLTQCKFCFLDFFKNIILFPSTTITLFKRITADDKQRNKR